MESFAIKDCSLLALATGKRAQNLKELREILLTIETGSIYYHFWGNLLQPRFEEREYNNDFASWVRHATHDDKLAERLAVIDPGDYSDLESLRQELLDVIEERLDEVELVPWSRVDEQFEFIHSQIVVFDTRKRLNRPEELASVVAALSPSSVFYHFIDARRRSEQHVDDFRAWLCGFGAEEAEICERLAAVDPYFFTLAELRRELAGLFADHYGTACP
jgi:hypothetical protein